MKIHFVFILLFIFSCNSKNEQEKINNIDYELAWKYWNSGNRDSAYVYFNKAKSVFQIYNDNVGFAKSLINMAIIEGDYGDYYGSQESSLEAIPYLNPGVQSQREIMSSTFNNLGKVTQNLKDYRKAESFYKEAIKLTKDKASLYIYKNNLANNYRHLNKFQKSIRIYEGLLENRDIKNNKLSYYRILDNLAFTKFLQNKNYNVESQFLSILKLRENENDLWGQNASHSHLSDYFAEKNTEKSLLHAKKMYEIATNIKSPDDQLEALQKLIKLDHKNYQKYFLRFQLLNDSLQTARNKAKNQFALIRYETEKNKTENERLKAEYANKENEVLRRNITVGILIAILLSAIFWYRKRQKIQAQKEQINIKNTKLRYSKKVHDVVANGLYQTMVEIQNLPEFNKEKVLNQIEKLYEESRDIAQDDSTEIPDKEFSAKIYQMISSYNTDTQKIYIVGNSPELWERVSPHIQSEVYYVVREFLVNMKKHSHAKLISLKFENNQEALKIKYTDNGIGINNLETRKGSGIQNTENRIATIGGEINFEKNPKGGLMINIVIPIH